MGLTAQSRVPVQLEMQPPERLGEKEKGGIVFKAGRGLFLHFVMQNHTAWRWLRVVSGFNIP